MKRENPDVIGISETWLSNDISNETLGLSDYNVFRADRGGGNDPHGGVLIGVRNKFQAKCVVSDPNFETVIASLQVNHTCIKIVTCYRTPSMIISENNLFVDFLRSKLERDDKYVMMGDFNYPGIQWSNFSASNQFENSFVNFVNENCLHQHVQEPTRGENILDLVLSSDADQISNLKVGCTFSSSDHSSISYEINFYSIENHSRSTPNFRKADWDTIRLFFSCIDWPDEFQNKNANDMYEKMCEKINFAIDNFVPKSIIYHSKYAVWDNVEIDRLLTQKKHKWDLFKRNPSRRNKTRYNSFAKYVSRQVKKIKSDYEKNKFENKNQSPKIFSNYVKNVTGNRTNADVPQLESNGSTFRSDYQKALLLDNQYKSVYTIDDGVYPPCQQEVEPNSLCSINVTDNHVLNAMKAMNKKSACGEDYIYACFIGQIMCYMVQPLKMLFQKSFESGVVPDAWKKGIIIPIYKNNRKPQDPASYRPVCLTSTIAKLAERVLLSFLTPYLQENDIISPSQHAFVAGKSTGTNLLDSLNDWTNCIDAQQPVDILYIDLAKAFDSVSHSKLLYKLEKLGIGGNILEWLSHFLCERLHCVRVKAAKTEYEPVLSGIPQGTILGPTMFILYINDLLKLQLSSVLKLYADDAKLYRKTISDEDTGWMQQDIDHIATYFEDWQLKVNIDKCAVLYMGYNNRRSQYHINDNVVPRETSCRDLGIKISNDMKFALHISEIVRSAFFRLKQLRVSFSCKEIEFQVYMYTTYVRPILEYNTYVWSPHLLKDIDKVESVQRYFTRQLPGLQGSTYRQRLQATKLQSLEERRLIFDMVMVYKIVNNLVDLNFEDYFRYNDSSTRGHNFKLVHQYSRVNCRKFFFANRVVTIWNNIPNDIVNKTSLQAFKKGLSQIDFKFYCRGHAMTT